MMSQPDRWPDRWPLKRLRTLGPPSTIMVASPRFRLIASYLPLPFFIINGLPLTLLRSFPVDTCMSFLLSNVPAALRRFGLAIRSIPNLCSLYRKVLTLRFSCPRAAVVTVFLCRSRLLTARFGIVYACRCTFARVPGRFRALTQFFSFVSKQFRIMYRPLLEPN